MFEKERSIDKMTRRFQLKYAFAGAGVLALALWTALPVYATQNENATQESTQSNQGTQNTESTQSTTEGTQSTESTQTTTEGTQSTQGAEGNPSTSTQSSDSTQTPEGTQSTQNNQTTNRTDTTQTEGTQSTQGESGTGDQPRSTQTQSDTMQNTGDAQGGQMQTALGGNERKFVMEASQSGRAEVALGQIAAERASNDEVKQFARRMVDDHSKANVEMKQMATSLGVQLPPALPGKDARMRERLMTLSGAEFDRAYMKHMVEDHEKAVRMFEKQANGAKDATVKDFASKTLPALQEHLKMAQDIHAKLEAAGTTTEGTGTTPTGTDSSTTTP
jgi:putative membrane protein